MADYSWLMVPSICKSGLKHQVEAAIPNNSFDPKRKKRYSFQIIVFWGIGYAIFIVHRTFGVLARFSAFGDNIWRRSRLAGCNELDHGSGGS